MSIVDEVINLITDPLFDMGIDVYEVTYQKEGKELVLRILIEKKDGSYISLDDIVKASELISPLLDEKDVIKDDNYMLDVASIGAEHPIKLEKLDNYVSKYVNLHLIKPIDGENIVEGTIESITDDIIILAIKVKTRIKKLEIERSNIDRARLAIKF